RNVVSVDVPQTDSIVSDNLLLKGCTDRGRTGPLAINMVSTYVIEKLHILLGKGFFGGHEDADLTVLGDGGVVRKLRQSLMQAVVVVRSDGDKAYHQRLSQGIANYIRNGLHVDLVDTVQMNVVKNFVIHPPAGLKWADRARKDATASAIQRKSFIQSISRLAQRIVISAIGRVDIELVQLILDSLIGGCTVSCKSGQDVGGRKQLRRIVINLL